VSKTLSAGIGRSENKGSFDAGREVALRAMASGRDGGGLTAPG